MNGLKRESVFVGRVIWVCPQRLKMLCQGDRVSGELTERLQVSDEGCVLGVQPEETPMALSDFGGRGGGFGSR